MFLNHEAIAGIAASYPGHVEIRLKEHARCAGAAARSRSNSARIYRFELVEPSLEEIFIQTVGGKVDA